MIDTGRKPVSVAPKNRKLVWKVIRELKTFTLRDIENKVKVKNSTIFSYLKALEKAQILNKEVIYQKENPVKSGRALWDTSAHFPNLTKVKKPNFGEKDLYRKQMYTLHSQLPLADAYSLDNIISSPVSGKSQGSGRQYHQTVDIASPSRLNAAISELEYDCYDLKVTGSSFRTTDDKLYQLNSALKIKDPWIELNDSIFNYRR